MICLHLLLMTAVLPFQVSSKSEDSLIMQGSNDPTSVWPVQPQTDMESKSAFKKRASDVFRFASQEEHENEENLKLGLPYPVQSEDLQGIVQGDDKAVGKKRKFERLEADVKMENKIYKLLTGSRCPVNTQKCEIPHSEKDDEVCVIKKKGSTPEIYAHSVYSPQQINKNNLEVELTPSFFQFSSPHLWG